MSESVQLTEKWSARLSASPVFSNLDVNRFYFEVDRKLTREGRGSPVDADILANAILLPKQSGKPLSAVNVRDRLDQLEDILKRFRRTPQTNLAMPSMNHAVIRAHLETGNTVSLLRMLRNKQDYGVFADDFANLLMLDHFLRANNFRDASKVAIEVMLQEDYATPIVSQAALYAAFRHAQALPQLDDQDEQVQWNPKLPGEESNADGSAANDDDEEEKVRVWFVDNDYHDEHFDLNERHHLLGKTISKFAEHGLSCAKNPAVKLSLELVGYALFQKWDTAAEICAELEQGKDNVRVAQSCVDIVLNYAANLPDLPENQVQAKNDCLEKLANNISSKVDASIDVQSFLLSELNKSAAACSSDLIESQGQVYAQWIADREAELRHQMNMYEKELRMAALKKTKLELEEKEEELFFFDNYEQMEKEKIKKYQDWRKTFPPKSGIKMPAKEVVKDDYVPPELR